MPRRRPGDRVCTFTVSEREYLRLQILAAQEHVSLNGLFRLAVNELAEECGDTAVFRDRKRGRPYARSA